MWSYFKLRRAVAAGFAALVVAAPLAAQGAERYRVRPWPEGVALGLAATAAWAPLLAGRGDTAGICPCDPNRVGGLDRIAIGTPRHLPDVVSDVGMAGTVLAAGALIAAHAVPGGEWEDLAVMAQSLGITVAATNLLKVLVERPRPFLYAGTPVRIADDARSFPSGHTSVAFAAAAAYLGIQARRGALDGRRRALAAGTLSLATLTGVARVAAHKHFPTDVLGGAILGTAVGLLVPRVYQVR